MELSDDEIMVIDSSDDMNLVITEVVSLAEANENEKCKRVRQRPSASQSHIPNTCRSSIVSTCSQLPSSTVFFPPSFFSPPCPASSSALKISESPTSMEVPIECAVKSLDEPIPCIENCLVGWKDIFPWVQYGEDRIFSCSVCKWGFDSPEYFQVYKLEKENGIYCVAARLRSHAKKKHHSIALNEQAVLLGLCKGLYPLLKHSFSKISGIDEIQKSVCVFLGNTLQTEKPGESQSCIADPLSDLNIDKQSLASLVIKNLSSAIQMQFFESLKQSPFFSIITWGCSNSAIVRWLTQDFEVVEHFFASNLSTTGEVLPVLSYLQYCGVQMDRMVSYSDLTNNIGSHINSQTCIVNIADRPCPLELCIKWLRTVELFENYFNHIKVIPKLCQILLKRCQDPIVKEIANIEDSDACKCIFSAKIVKFALKSYRLLDDAVKSSDLESKEKLDFLKLGREKFSLPETFFIDFLPDLHDIIKKYDTGINISMLQNLKVSLVSVKKYDKSVLTSILELFLDHLIFCLSSQRTTNCMYVNIMIKDMACVTQHEFEYVCKVLMTELSDSGYQQIKDLHNLLGRKSKTSPLKLLADLQFQPKFHQRFPELLRLGQKIMTIPILPAHVERYSYDFVVARKCLVDRLPDYLIPCFVYILLEGPDSVEHIDTENILKEWCKSQQAFDLRLAKQDMMS